MSTVVLLFSAPTSATLGQLLRCFELSFRLDDAGPLFAHRFGFHGHHALHVLRYFHVFHLEQLDRYAPGSRGFKHGLPQQRVDLVPLLQHFVEIVLADHIASVVSANRCTARRKSSTVSTAFSGFSTRYQSTAFTFTVTLSRVIVSCCSVGLVTMRRFTRTLLSMPSGIQPEEARPAQAVVSAQPDTTAR